MAAAAAAARAEAAVLREQLKQSRDDLMQCRERLARGGELPRCRRRHEAERTAALGGGEAAAELRQRLAVAEATAAELRASNEWLRAAGPPPAGGVRQEAWTATAVAASPRPRLLRRRPPRPRPRGRCGARLRLHAVDSPRSASKPSPATAQSIDQLMPRE